MDPGSFSELLGLLQLPRNADDKDISRAYRKVALQMHPDKGGNADMMKRLNALMEQYRSSGGSSGPDLTCNESPLDSEDEDPEEGPSGASASAGYFSQSMPRSPPVSSQEYISAYMKLLKFKVSMDAFLRHCERRKQCLTPEFGRMAANYHEIPWGVFGRLFKETDL